MSTKYNIEDLQKKRESAGLGTLSIGTCGMSGEMVSSTPIPDSRCGGPGTSNVEYGGYLVGEGMTRAVALYLASLHNLFPGIAADFELLDAEASKAKPELEREYLDRIAELIKEKWILETRIEELDKNDPLSALKRNIRLLRHDDQHVKLEGPIEAFNALKAEGAKEERERIIRLLEGPVFRFSIIKGKGFREALEHGQ